MYEVISVLLAFVLMQTLTYVKINRAIAGGGTRERAHPTCRAGQPGILLLGPIGAGAVGFDPTTGGKRKRMRQLPDKAPDRTAAQSVRARALSTLAVASLLALGAASPAAASLKQDMQRFADCPYNNPAATQCVYSTTTGGEFVIGKSAVPITKTVTIQGGLTPPQLVPAADGNTLSKTPLPVPGGLIGIELPGNFTEVTATAELAGTGSIASTVSLPLKVKLDNISLGSNCYIGSEAEPLNLNLVYGTTNPPPPNKPISGSAKVTSKDNAAIKVIEGTLVDNAFAAPGATGCTLLPLVGDLAVNVKEGLPAAAGTNTAIMSGTTEETAASLVAAVLPLPDFGRCVHATTSLEGKKTIYHGAFVNSGCTIQTPEKSGKFEWVPGPGPAKGFTGTLKPVKLETVGHRLVTCTGGSDTGEYTGTKTETLSLELSGCASAGAACQSSGAAAGVIDSAALQGSVEFIKENEGTVKPLVGLDIVPVSGSQLAAFECGGAAQTVTGSVIVPIGTVNKMTGTITLKPKAAGGKQAPEAFEVGPSHTLSLGGEQAGLTSTATQLGEEPIELKATA